MFTMPPRIPTDKEDWHSILLNASTLYLEVSELYAGTRRLIKTRNNAGTPRMTVVNPFTDLVFYLLNFYNNPNKVEKLGIVYNTASLQHGLPLVSQIPLDEQELFYSPDRGVLRIHLVTLGTRNISNLPTETELKTASMALQRSNQHRIRLFKRNEQEYDLYTNVWSWEIYYKVVALLPQLFPKIFPRIPDEVRDLMLALVALDVNGLIRIITKWYEDNDPKKAAMLVKFGQWIKSQRQTEIQNAEASVGNLKRTIDNYTANLRDTYKQLYTQQMLLLGLTSPNAEDNEDRYQDLIDYMQKNKSILKFDLIGPEMHISFKTPLKYVDVDALQHNYIRKRRYDKDITQLFKEAFVDETVEIYTYTSMIFNMTSANVVRGNYLEHRTHFPHPHIMGANCWGDNKYIIQEALREQDILKAIEQATATTLNLNVVDTIIMNKLVSGLQQDYTNTPSIKILETGEMVSYRQYLERKRNNETNSNE